MKLKMILSRIFALFLCLFVVAFCVFSPAASLPPAKAAAITDVDATAEALMALYSFFETCAIAGGVSEGLDSYEEGMDLLDAFIQSLSHAAIGGAPPITFTLEDGTVVTYSEVMESLEAFQVVDGSSALKGVISEDTFARFRVIDGGGGEDPDKGPFNKIQKIVIGTGASLVMTDFFGKLYNGEIEGINAADYYGNWFDGTYQRDSEGNYILSGTINDDALRSDGYHSRVWTISGTMPYRPAMYFGTDFQGNASINIMVYDESNDTLYENANNRNFPDIIWNYYMLDSSGSGAGKGFSFFGSGGLADPVSYSFNIPVFESKEDAKAFLTGEEDVSLSGMLNLQPYIISTLVGSIMDAVAPLVGTQLNPAALPAASAAAAAAAQTLPEPASDPDANTEVYKQAVTDAVAEAVPNPEPEPSPDQDPVISGTEAVKKYKRDLTLIFPFCIPFDLIHFFEVMNAEPVAPCFHIPFVVEPLNIDMDVELDMAFLEPAMEIFRWGELGLFIIGLIMATSKVIRW